MSKEMIEIIVKAIALILNGVLVYYIIPWIKEKKASCNNETIKEYAEIAVRCAEQVFSTDEWQKKKQYATEFVAKKVGELGVDMSVDDINALVESVVNLVKYGSDYTK